jgi:hypothetical protein
MWGTHTSVELCDQGSQGSLIKVRLLAEEKATNHQICGCERATRYGSRIALL